MWLKLKQYYINKFGASLGTELWDITFDYWYTNDIDLYCFIKRFNLIH